MILNYRRIILRFIFIVSCQCLFVFLPDRVSASNYTFIDVFDEEGLNLDWITIDSHSVPTIASDISHGSVAFFQGLDSKNYEYIGYTRDEIVRDVEFDFYYDDVSFVSQGSGFMLTDHVPLYSQVPPNDNDYYSVGLWPLAANGYFYLLSPLCDNTVSCGLSIYSRAVYKVLPGIWHKIKISYSENNVLITIDDIPFNLLNGNFPLPNGVYFGNPEITSRDQTWRKFKIDNLIINYQQETTLFPHYSQLDEAWRGDEYDHASTWASEGNREMEEWGCVVSSAAMILKHYGINHPTTDAVTDPQILNDWLSGEPDGYVRGGLTNWLALTRYAHLSELAGYSTTSLEYLREIYSESGVSTRLASDPSVPVIVRNTNSHFLPIYGESTENWLISDPLATTSGEIAKTTPLLTSNILVPSNTDLSYMMFVIEPDAILRLYDELGNLLTTESVIEELGGTGGAGQSVQIVYYRQPIRGVYRVEIENPGESADPIEMYFYNQDGEVEQVTDELPGGDSKGWEITYYKDDEDIVDFVTLDIMAPAIPTLLSPSNGSIAQPSGLILDWSDVSDPSEPVTYNYKSSWTGGSYGPVSTGSSSQIDASGSADRRYNWQVQACDSAGNCSEWSDLWTVIIDGTAPNAPLIVAPDEDEYYQSSPILNDWSDVTDLNGIDYYRIEYQYDDQHTFSGYPYRTTMNSNRNHTPATWEQGGVKYRVQAWDLAGNEGDWSEWRHYYYDSMPPTQPGTPITLPNPTNGLLQSWLWDASVDNGSGVSGYYNRIYNALSGTYLSDWLWLGKVLGTTTDLTDGEWQMVVKSIDEAENESGMASSDVLLVDTIMPVLASKTSLPNNWYNTAQTVSFGYSDLHLLSSYTDPWCEINIESSSSYCYVTPYVCDTAGNCNSTQVFSDPIGLDMTKPSITMAEWGSRISGTASDTLSGIDRVEIRVTKPGESETTVTAVGTTDWSYTIEPAPVGDYQIYVLSYDKAGNVSDEIANSFTINESDPPSSPDVLGATTESSPTPSPSPTLVSTSYSPTPSVNPSPSPSVSPGPEPEVLGESDDGESEKNYWWWLLLLLIPTGWYLYQRD